MQTATLTIQLPEEDLDFAQRYAQAHRISLNEFFDRHLRLLRHQAPMEIHPEVERLSGLVPSHVDAREENRQHLLKKHG